MKRLLDYKRFTVHLAIGLAVIAGVFFLVQNCGQQQTVGGGASLRSINCDCRDMLCWRDSSNDASKKAFSCAGSALGATAAGFETAGAAGSVIYTAATETKALLKQSENFYKIFADIYNLGSATITFSLGSGQGGLISVSLLDLFKNLSGSAGDALNIFGGADINRSPGLKCLAEGAGISSKIFDTLSIMGKYVQAQGNFDYLQEFKALNIGVDDLTKMATFFGTCAVAIERDPTVAGPGKVLVSQMGSYIKLVSGPLKIALALGECGFAITGGLINLGGNTACAYEDVLALIDSSASLGQARQAYVDRPLQGGDGTPGYECNNEYVGEAVAAMTKYGIFLSRQNFYSYVYRSSACGDYCGNASFASQYCLDNADAIFGADADNCRATCTTRQSAGATERCLSYCCGQDSGCAQDAGVRAQGEL